MERNINIHGVFFCASNLIIQVFDLASLSSRSESTYVFPVVHVAVVTMRRWCGEGETGWGWGEGIPM